jgi:glycosyltransferase involved in cell wall biosynthesis
MKILILTSSHPLRHAGIVAFDLAKGLNCIGNNDVRIVTSIWGNYSDKKIIPIGNKVTEFKRKVLDISLRILNKLIRITTGYNKRMIRTDQDYAIQDYNQTITFYKSEKMLKRSGFIPDAIIVLFMPHFISFKNLHELHQLTKAPVFIYFMDMAPMTGGCHYAWECKGYQGRCGKCPALFSSNNRDQSNENWEFKMKYINKSNVTAVACTEWQYQQLQKSSLYFLNEKHKILLGIDSELFKPGIKKQAREYFNLPDDKKIIFFGAVWYESNRNKGFNELKKALTILKENITVPANIHLAIAGHVADPSYNDFPFDCTYLGYLDHKQLAKAFQSADVFVSPSIEDSGPMMVNQSIMCGTPVVAFEVGVAIDLVFNGKTGFKAKLMDSNDLANGLKFILELQNDAYNRISNECREMALKTISTEIQAKEFMKLLKNNKIK